MIFPHKTTFWTLRNQLRTLLVLSGVLVVLLSILGGWWLHQFDNKNNELLNTSRTLSKDLEKNFHDARLLTEIQADLDIYMRSAPLGILHKIHTRAETLRLGLPPELRSQLASFVKQLDILEIRMNSFRQNNDTIFSIEREIIQETDNLLKTVPFKFNRQIRQISSNACLKHHYLYKGIILTDEQADLNITAREYEQMFLTIENRINELEKHLPGESSGALKKFQNAFYELDESISTVIAIRRVTLETKNDVNSRLSSLRTAVADASLDQANILAELTRSGMDFLKNNLLAISVIMVTMAVLGAITALFLSRTMVKPLIAFTNMLKKMTRMLSGLRSENEFEEDFSALLETMTDQRDDEIGQVATAVKQLLLRLRELAVFRQDIEADETSAEVYQRMARIFSDRLDLNSCIIFELTPDGKLMRPALRQITLPEIELPEISLTDECRARRNNSIVSSFKDNHTCSMFPMAERLRYVCIPMQISGQVIGLVQFLFSPEDVEKNSGKISESLLEARHYIAEALPVLHAKRLTYRLQIMATEDPLTGLYNRYYLETSLERLVAGAKRRQTNICILMCDLDHFKNINDTYGHDAGDKVLQQLAGILLRNVRKTDFVIRFGGEEFMILLVDCDTQKAGEMAERIRFHVQTDKFHIPGHSIEITVSIGTAIFRGKSDQDIWDHFKAADIALYQAKANGRNQVVHYNGITDNMKQLSLPGQEDTTDEA
jgi:diguanylate cyclase (GGDEF)-like protein